MIQEFSNATPKGYFFESDPANEAWYPIDPPDGSGGGLAGDPIKGDYTQPPEAEPTDPPVTGQGS